MLRALILGVLIVDFSALPLGHLDQVALAAHDILHSDTWIRDAFGGRALGGTASVDPASTALTGTGTTWSSELNTGSRLVLGSQVTAVEEVLSDTAVTLRTPHADGLIGQEIAVAARGFRVDRPDAPLRIALPYYTVGAGTLPSYEAGIGRLITDPSVQVTFFYAPANHPVTDSEGTWASLVQRVALRLKEPDGVRLTVPRFGMSPLTRGLTSVSAGTALIPDGDGTVLYAPAMAITWSGLNPASAVTIPQRW